MALQPQDDFILSIVSLSHLLEILKKKIHMADVMCTHIQIHSLHLFVKQFNTEYPQGFIDTSLLVNTIDAAVTHDG